MMNSESYYAQLSKYTPNGSQTLSKMPSRFVDGVYPKVLDRGKNGHVWDVDGNEYIDLISGLGAVSVGYAHNEVNDAVIMQLMRGASFSLPHWLEGAVARRLTEIIPWTHMWKFGKNGTDGTVMAVRCARAFTGRDKIMTVGYNGCADVFECIGVRNAGIPSNLKEHNVKATYNDINSFSDLKTGQYACLLMEPMVYERPKQRFLEELRDICTNSGTLLIFDEVVTGGRFEKFVAHQHFEVMPDIVVLSKGIANGLPLSAVGSTRRIMATFERDDFFASGTFGGECLSLASCLETLDILQQSLSQMIWNGFRIQEAFNKVFDGAAVCKGYPTRLVFEFPTKNHKALFMQEMCLQGVLIGHANMIMASHTDADVTETVNAIYKSSKTMKEHWNAPFKAMKGVPPSDVFKLR